MAAKKKMISVEAGIQVLSNISKEKRFDACLQMLRLQTSRCLYRGEDGDLTVHTLGRAMSPVGAWLRGVNRKGKFGLPLKHLEIVFYRELEAATKLRLFSIWGALCGKATVRNTPGVKRTAEAVAPDRVLPQASVSTSVCITSGGLGQQTLAAGGMV
jgi:hypothetical protein